MPKHDLVKVIDVEVSFGQNKRLLTRLNKLGECNHGSRGINDCFSPHESDLNQGIFFLGIFKRKNRRGTEQDNREEEKLTESIQVTNFVNKSGQQ